MQNQRYLCERIAEHPNLRVAIVSDDIGEYVVDSLDASVFDIRNTDGIYDYFNNNPTTRLRTGKTP